ncbi:MAG: hypothetical protein OEX12_14440 [Gammaproteobacteria bacterium]|nr:hypothetical protein [Gammaproteobacteria bacterium]
MGNKKLKVVILETGVFQSDNIVEDLTEDTYQECKGSLLVDKATDEFYYVAPKKAGAAILVKLPGVIVADYYLRKMTREKIQEDIANKESKNPHAIKVLNSDKTKH